MSNLFKIPIPTAFSAKSPGIANVLVSEVALELPSFMGLKTGPPEKFLAIWDTGATNSVITLEAANKLKLVPTGKVNTHGVHGTSEVNKYMVNLILPNNLRIKDLTVSESISLGGNYHVLIGMDVIGKGDFAVSHANNQTMFSFRYPPSLKHIDFVEEINSAQARIKLSPTSSGGGSQYRTGRRKK